MTEHTPTADTPVEPDDPAQQGVLVTYPAKIPTALLQALEPRLAALPWVATAYLGQIHVLQPEPEELPRLIVGIEATSLPPEAEQSLYAAFAGLPAGLPAFEWISMKPSNPIADVLCKYPPFYRARPRGFLARLFGRS